MMTGQERPSKHPPKTAQSGQHPAVKAYRAKLGSIDKKVCEATTELDRKLQQFLTDLKTPVPEEAPTSSEPPPMPPPRKPSIKP